MIGRCRDARATRSLVIALVVTAEVFVAGMCTRTTPSAGTTLGPAGPSVAAGRGQASFAAKTAVDGCPGAPLPVGYAEAGSIPYSVRALTGARYNPQGIVLFMGDTRVNTRATVSDRRCLLTWAVQALTAGSRTEGFVDDRGQRRMARLYPYPYAFSANPSLPDLEPGWVSALAQGSVLAMMSTLYDDTGDGRYLRLARETFNSFLLPYPSGGFVSLRGGVTYLQEYVTREPAYVLNGHIESTIALVNWARRSGDPRALELARRALAALHTTTRLEEIAFPTGLATSYDLLRGRPAAPVRVVPANRLSVYRASLVGADRSGRLTTLGAVALAIQKAAGPGRELLRNAAFSSWSGGVPTGWTVTGRGRAGGVYRGGILGSVRVRSDGTAHVAVQQTLPRLRKDTLLTVSWTARLAVTSGVASTPGDVVLQSVCGKAVRNVAVADVRSPRPVPESISGRIPAGCAPRVKLYQADGSAPSDVTYSDVSVRLADPVGTARAPVYPLSVLDVPTVSIRLTYTGNGWLQGWWRGRWITFGFLPGGARRTVTIDVPAYLQGRTINLRYHNAHVAELTRLYELTGDPMLRARALAWLPYAPAMEWCRARLAVAVPPHSAYADLFG